MSFASLDIVFQGKKFLSQKPPLNLFTAVNFLHTIKFCSSMIFEILLSVVLL